MAKTTLVLPRFPTMTARWDVVYRRGNVLGVVAGVDGSYDVPPVPDGAREVARIFRQPGLPFIEKIEVSDGLG